MRSTAIGTFTVAMVGCALASAGSEARADNAIPASNGAGMDTHLFRPAMDSKGFFTVNGTEVLGANQTSFGLIIDYGNDLLRVPYKGQSSNQLINHSFTGTFQFNYGLFNRVVVGVDLPVGLVVGDQQADGAGNPTSPNQWATTSTNSQTLDLIGGHAKWRITRLTDPVGLALGVQIGGSPTNAPHNAGADPGFFYWPQLMAEKKFGTGGWFKLGANAGYRGHTGRGTDITLRNGTYADGDLFTYGGAASIRVLDPVDIIAETYGSYLLETGASSGVRASNEVVGGLKLFVEQNSYFILGAGPRYTPGFEAANVRAFLGFVFEPSIGDRDGDGIPDDLDKCPDEPEDKDGFQDDDGCPDPDNDNDGIPDINDKCPNEPEDMDGDHDEDGCPEVTDGDRDGDGIPDSRDKCPDVPRTATASRTRTAARIRTTTRTASPTSSTSAPTSRRRSTASRTRTVARTRARSSSRTTTSSSSTRSSSRPGRPRSWPRRIRSSTRSRRPSSTTRSSCSWRSPATPTSAPRTSTT